MKKLILALALGMFSLGFSQNYPYNNGYGNNGWPEKGYYGDEEDSYYFPDDYYYEYPNDYYSDDYYESYYNDYRRSISMVNWDRFFYEFGLTNYQINMIIDLNRQFGSYNVWNNYYRMNPNRWYYDRFYALQRILGVRVFVVFQNRYYNGYSPVDYYNNYWRDYYRPRYRVAPMYRNVNINVYHVDRYSYHQNVGNRYGWNQPRNPHNPGGFREGNNSNPRSSGTWNNSSSNRTQARSNDSGMRSSVPSTTRENGGYRNNTPRSGGYESPRAQQNGGFENQRSQSNGGYQNQRSNNSGMRSSAPRNDNGGFQNQRSAPQQQRNENGNRGNSNENRSSNRSSGMRFTSNP